jgi:hypothetical protein
VKPRALTIAELERVNHITANNSRNLAHEIAKLATLATDANAAHRREAQRCAACEYLKRYRIAGQGFTRWNCQLCATEQPSHPNTAVPRLCSGCAKAYGLCVDCGGDIETEHRGRRTGKKARVTK